MQEQYDVIITGGSYAGLSAAMALGRALRKVLIIDGGRPCNIQTPHSHNFLTRDGQTPAAIAEEAKAQVLKYSTVDFMNDLVTGAQGEDRSFRVETGSEQAFRAKKLLFATGLRDVMPDIPGFAECWGISVIHCPYCHGYEYAGEKTGILAHGESALMLANLIANWTDDLTVYTNGPAQFDHATLAAKGIKIVEKKVRSIEHDGGNIKALRFDDGSAESPRAVYAWPKFEQHSGLPRELGCEHTAEGHIRVDEFRKTSVAGVFAAGDNSSLFRAVSIAAASGTMAGAAINKELIDESP